MSLYLIHHRGLRYIDTSLEHLQSLDEERWKDRDRGLSLLFKVRTHTRIHTISGDIEWACHTVLRLGRDGEIEIEDSACSSRCAPQTGLR
jgi:hypothetical protein